MFLSARNVLRQQKKKIYEKIPKELLEALNKNTSKRFSYKSLKNANQIAAIEKMVDDNEAVVVTAEIDKIKSIPSAVKGLTLKDIYQYAYNTQQKIKLQIEGPMPAIIDHGKKLPIACSIYNGESLKTSTSTIIIEPPSFSSRKVAIQVEDIVEEVNFIQEKSQDNYTYKFRGTGQYFFFAVTFYTQRDQMDISASINLHGTVPLKDITKTLKIYRGFCNRKIKIDGHELEYEVTEQEHAHIGEICSNLNRDIAWWEHIQKLENVFQEELLLPIPLPQDKILMLDKLYIGLVLKEAYRADDELVEDIRITLLDPIDKDIIGKTVTFTLLRLVDLSSINIRKSVYDVVCLCDVKIARYDELNAEKNEYKLIIEKKVSNKPYVIHHYFLTETEAKPYLKNFRKDAKSLREFDIIRT